MQKYCRTVGAVYDRAHVVDTTKNARSQSAPTVTHKTCSVEFCNTLLNRRGIRRGGHVSRIRLVLILSVVFCAIQLVAAAYEADRGEYYPPRDNWERRKPADVGM